jgi:hypothetical protein
LEAMCFSETSVFIKATRRHIEEDDILLCILLSHALAGAIYGLCEVGKCQAIENTLDRRTWIFQDYWSMAWC